MPAECRQARPRVDGTADVRSRTTSTARLEIVDDGVGFDTFEHPLGSDEMGGYGLLSMAERAEIVGGRLNIRSRPGSGTAVTATIPLPELAASGYAASGSDLGRFGRRCSQFAFGCRLGSTDLGGYQSV